MKTITEEMCVGFDKDGRPISADRLSRWAFNQLEAAPRLLEACKCALKELCFCACAMGTDETTMESYNLLVDAIAKVEDKHERDRASSAH